MAESTKKQNERSLDKQPGVIPSSSSSDIEAPAQSDLTGYPGAMEETGLCLNTLYALVHRKKIPHIRLSSRLVRFSRSALRAWLNQHQVEVRGGQGAGT